MKEKADASNVTITIKVKLAADKESAASFDAVTIAYTKACNDVSKFLFDSGELNMSTQTLHSNVYQGLRKVLKSQMACSVSRTVRSRYDAIATQMENEPYVFECDGKRYTCKRDLDWLRRPVCFRKPFTELARGRDWSFVTVNGETRLSINTLGKRRVVPYNHHFDDILFRDDVKLGRAILLKKKGTWYLYISATLKADIKTPKHIKGTDRGLRFVMTTYDGKDTTFVNGCDIAKKKAKYHNTRKSLQSKGTKGARRVLKRMSGRENRWMDDVNHCLSKTLVSEPETLIVLEDLTGISMHPAKGKEFNRELSSWAFYDLEQKIIYKAALAGNEVISVPARYTSQRCPKCGSIDKANRNRKEHLFRCRKCGYTSNDDRVAAMNLYELGRRYLKTGNIKGFPKQ